MVAFLGMGLLGTNFVKAMLKKGAEVQVWNRTPDKATALETDGAKTFALPADAVRNADVIHVTLKDDASVSDVLNLAQSGFKPGAIIVDHTTTSVEGAIERTKLWKERGYTYLHAPVFMGPINALESTGFMLVSGDQSVISKLEPQLSAMTGRLINYGEETGKAAGMKLIGNLFLVSFTTGIADSLSLASALNIPSTDVGELFDIWNPAMILQARLKKVAGGKYDNPSWELGMARKDTQLFMDTASKAGKGFIAIPAIAKKMDQLIAEGHAKDDWTVLGKDANK